MDKQNLPFSGKKINLIPSELAVSPKTVRLTKLLNKITVVGVIVLFLSILSAVSFFVYFRLQSTKISENISTLKGKIIALESSEQKLVITKDRINKIAQIEKFPSAKENIESFDVVQNLVGSVPESTLAEASIQSSKTELSLLSKTSESLSSLLGPLSKLSNYKSMVLSSLGFSSTSGFISELIIK